MSVKDYKLALTTAGLALMAKIQVGDGKVPLDITRVVISSDANGDPLNMAVSDVDIALNMDIMSREIIGGARTEIRVKATNIGNPFADPPVPPVMKPFLLRRILFFANDPDDGEIVYRVSQFSSPNYVPAVTESPWTFEPTFNFVTSDASDVTIVVDPKGLATIKQVEEVKRMAQEALDLAQSKQGTIVSDTQPNEQANGDLWFDTSDGESDYEENGIIIANAVVSETEPNEQFNGDLWLHTHQQLPAEPLE